MLREIKLSLQGSYHGYPLGIFYLSSVMLSLSLTSFSWFLGSLSMIYVSKLGNINITESSQNGNI